MANTVSSMKWVAASNYEEMCQIAAEIFVSQIKQNPKSVLGMATGGTPLGLYKKLVEHYHAKEISFSDVQSFNLDEYIGLDPHNEMSYHYYMAQNLFNHVDIKEGNWHVPAGNASNLEEVAQAYDAAIEAAGGIDLQLLGIGTNGHIGFNEPGTPFSLGTNVVKLAESTREANKIYFEKIEDVPTHAITMGINTILQSRAIVLLINSSSKQEAFNRLRSGEITEEFPASALHNHPNVTVIYTDVK